MQQNTGNAGERLVHSSQVLSSLVVDWPTVTSTARSWWQTIQAERWTSVRKTLEEAHLCYLEKHWLGVFCTLVPSGFY